MELAMTDTDHDRGSTTALFVSDDGPFLEAAKRRLRAAPADATVHVARSPDDAFVRLDDEYGYDCVVADDGVLDDVEAFVSRFRADHPNVPLVFRTDREALAGDPRIFSREYTNFVLQREDTDALDELSARLATLVAAAEFDSTGERGRRTSTQADKIEALHDAATDIVTCHTERAVYEKTVAAAERILEFDLCCTMVYDEGDDVLRPEAVSTGAPPDGTRPMATDQGQAGTAFQTGESQVVKDVLDEQESQPAKETYRSAMSVPIGDLAVFQAVSTDPGEFSEADVELVELLASHTKAALDRIGFDEALQNERDRFQTLIEFSSDLVTVIGSDGTIRYQSPSVERLLGYSPDETVGDNAFDYIHPDDRDRVRAEFEQAVETRDSVRTVEYRLRNRSGDWRVVESVGTNPLDDPAVEGFVVNSRDVTERKERLQKLEELPAVARKLRQSETALEVAKITVASARDVLGFRVIGIWLYDEEETVLRPVASSSESRELFDDLPTFRPEGESLSWEAFETGESRIYDDVRNTERVHNPETPVRSEMVFPLARYGVLNIGSTERERFADVDVYFARILAVMTESVLERLDHERSLRRKQQELRRQNERLDEFASVVSHDLRNPLNVAQGYVEAIAEADSRAETVELASHVRASLSRIESIAEDVLTLARQGQIIDDPDSTSLRAVAETAWGNVATGDTDLVVADEATVLADERRFARLLENLLRNAVEHGDADRVRIGVMGEDGGDGFYVEDDGRGLPAVPEEQLVDLEFTTADDGTGLGLAIVDRIAEAHGWEMSVAESGVGGARFEFRGVSSG